jgi:hypothetical protein
MNRPLAPWSAIPPARQLRVIGMLVLVFGVAGACLFYWIAARAAAPTMDDLFPGYSRNRARQIGILMGSMGVTMVQLLDALKDPFTEAMIIAVVAALVALILFRLASVTDQPDPGVGAGPGPEQ